MAESGENAEFSTAIGLLRQATDILSGVSSTTTSSNNSSSTTTSSNNSPAVSNQASNRESAVLTNFRNLFSSYGSIPYGSSSRSAPSSRNSARSSKRFAPYKVKETWTHEFFCLSNPEQEIVPSKSEKIQLQEVGLGRKKVVFGSKDGASEVKRKLETTYPKLLEGGGFEILRSGGRNELALLTPPTSGYSVSFLRDQSGLAQALAYIRPLQRALVVPGVVEVDSATAMTLEPTLEPTVKCLNCEALVPMSTLREHHDRCVSGPSSNSCGDDIRKYTVSSESCSEETEFDLTTGQQSINDAELNSLRDVFPTEPLQKLRLALREYKSADAAAVFLLREVGLEEQGYICDEGVDCAAKPLKVPLKPEEALRKWRQSTIDNSARREIISIDRTSPKLFKTLFAKYKRSEMNLNARTEIEFDGEPGVDAGSLTREYFNILMGLLRKGDTSSIPPLFEGEEDHIVPVHSVDALSSGCFYIAGQMIAHSLLHGGVGLAGMSRAVSRYIASEGNNAEEASVFLSSADVPDLDTRSVLLQIRDAEDETDFDALNNNELVSRLLLASGVSVFLSVATKSIAFQDLLLHEVLLMRHQEIVDISRGMQSLSLITFLKMSESLVNMVFPSLEDMVVSPEEIKSKISLHWEFSKKVMSTKEKQARDYLLTYLDHGIKSSAEEGVTMDLFLRFIQGCPGPLQDRTLRLKFHKTNETYPWVDACFVVLTLPVSHESYASFEETFNKAVLFGHDGYGKV